MSSIVEVDPVSVAYSVVRDVSRIPTHVSINQAEGVYLLPPCERRNTAGRGTDPVMVPPPHIKFYRWGSVFFIHWPLPSSLESPPF